MPLCSHGCGKEGIYYSKQTRKWRCCERVYECDGWKEKMHLSMIKSYKENPEFTKNLSQIWKDKYENGYIAPMTGNHHTEESKEKMSKTRKTLYKNGYINSNKGKQLTDEQKQKYRKTHKIIDGIEYKHCYICNKYKLLSEFYKSNENWDKLTYKCKCCYKRYEQDNRKRINKYQFNLKKTNIGYKLKTIFWNRILTALKRGHKISYKSAHTEELLGCSYEDAKLYIESLFEPDMVWEDFLNGEIELHHLQPCHTFDLSDTEQQKECFNISNIYPIWKVDHKYYSRELHYKI